MTDTAGGAAAWGIESCGVRGGTATSTDIPVSPSSAAIQVATAPGGRGGGTALRRRGDCAAASNRGAGSWGWYRGDAAGGAAWGIESSWSRGGDSD